MNSSVNDTLVTVVKQGIFQGKGVSLELGHFDKHFIYDTRKKGLAGRIFELFSWKLLKTTLLLRNL